MGKTAKKTRSDRRKALKRAAKAAKKALYASYAGTGKRAKKQTKKNTGPSAQRGNHVMSCCGNVGCERCFPQYTCKTANVA